jgi:kynurenine formamidase
MASRLSKEQVKANFEKINNWGRWGKEDQCGALNFITDAKRAAGARLVQSGEIVSCALPLSTQSGPDNPQPVHHMMLHVGPPVAALDYFGIASHGFAFTHLDALCHVFWEGKMYNGFSAREVGRFGARKCAIDVTRDGISTRGVLLDIPAVKKVDFLEPGEAIFPEDLDAAEKLHGNNVAEGDVLLIRTGRHRRREVKGDWNARREGLAGLDAACLPWLHERRIALLGCDGVSDCSPSHYAPEFEMPIHVGALVMMGVHLLDNANLDALAAACLKNRRYEFQFVMAPLILERGTASPVNPLAVL